MSGDDVKRNQTRQVQQESPGGAGTAGRASGEGAVGESDSAAQDAVRWVGLQHVMYGFCGRAPEGGAGTAGSLDAAPPDTPAAAGSGGGLQLRRNRAMALRVAPKQRVQGETENGGPGTNSRAA